MKYILLLIPLFWFSQTQAQANTTFQNLYWLRYYNQLSFNQKLTWHNEIEMRRFLDNNRLHHIIGHSHLHYKILPNVDVALGITYSEQSPQFSDATSTLVVPEIRPFQEVTTSQTFGKRISLSYRFRLDERFIRKNNSTVLLDGSDFNFRLRFRPQLNINLSKLESKTPTNLKISDELMVNFGGEILYNRFDQNRVYVGFEKVLSKNVSLELGYLHWFQQRNSGKDFFDRNILRMTVLHKMKL
jgi:Protein of unknown function (DUF2490)